MKSFRPALMCRYRTYLEFFYLHLSKLFRSFEYERLNLKQITSSTNNYLECDQCAVKNKIPSAPKKKRMFLCFLDIRAVCLALRWSRLRLGFCLWSLCFCGRCPSLPHRLFGKTLQTFFVLLFWPNWSKTNEKCFCRVQYEVLSLWPSLSPSLPPADMRLTEHFWDVAEAWRAAVAN